MDEMRNRLYQSQFLELEAERLSGAIKVKQYMVCAGAATSKELHALQTELQKTQAALQRLQGTNHGLVGRDEEIAAELEEAREELVQVRPLLKTHLLLLFRLSCHLSTCLNFHYLQALKHQRAAAPIGVKISTHTDLETVAPHASASEPPSLDLWNYEENRQATIKEGILTLLDECKKLKQN